MMMNSAYSSLVTLVYCCENVWLFVVKLLVLYTLGRESKYLVEKINTQIHVFNNILSRRSISKIHFSIIRTIIQMTNRY